MTTTIRNIHETFRENGAAIRDSNATTFVVLVLLRHFAWLPWRDHVKSLVARQSEFHSLNAQLVIVSFGDSRGCKKWYLENELNVSTTTTAAMISDVNRIWYSYFRLRRSFYKVWNTDTLDYYGEQVAAKRELPKAYKEVDDDPHQMGGDFIIKFNNNNNNENAIKNQLCQVLLEYKSKTPVDRPTCDHLIKTLKSSSSSPSS